ncbi:hypothetical protein HZA87_04400 [Candidatus Uhrbacteria bacterium]|nr:hypothetical protein [Candidatus Uhrbacteria bacterium]
MGTKTPIVMPDRAVPLPAPARKSKKPASPPTIHQVAESAKRFCKEMSLGDAFVAPLFAFAVSSVHTAQSLVRFAVAAVRAEQGRSKLRGDRHEIVNAFKDYLEKNRQYDFRAPKQEQEARNLLLRGIEQGEFLRRGPAVTEVILAWTIPAFDAVEVSDFAQIDLPNMIRGNLRLAEWLLQNALKDTPEQKALSEFTAAYEAAKAKDEESEEDAGDEDEQAAS